MKINRKQYDVLKCSWNYMKKCEHVFEEDNWQADAKII